MGAEPLSVNIARLQGDWGWRHEGEIVDVNMIRPSIFHSKHFTIHHFTNSQIITTQTYKKWLILKVMLMSSVRGAIHTATNWTCV